ncbi:hypothetical protein [Tolypothrix tenuis]|uniref:hypothetical protein n=1 Tax=Tolypothrix tenuis TaxID=457083 RepID=UPI0030DDC41F
MNYFVCVVRSQDRGILEYRYNVRSLFVLLTPISSFIVSACEVTNPVAVQDSNAQVLEVACQYVP